VVDYSPYGRSARDRVSVMRESRGWLWLRSRWSDYGGLLQLATLPIIATSLALMLAGEGIVRWVGVGLMAPWAFGFLLFFAVVAIMYVYTFLIWLPIQVVRGLIAFARWYRRQLSGINDEERWS